MSTQLTEDLSVVSGSNLEITYLDGDLNIIQALDDEPNDVGGLSSAQLKAKFDQAGNAIKTYLNETLIPEILAADATESVRESAEAARQSAEQARSSAEQGRRSAEQARAAAETQRLANETARVSAEGERTSAETQRAQKAAAMEVWEDYSAAKQYVPLNKVAYMGSSYICIQPCQGVEPTNGSYWLMIARKGLDGATVDTDGSYGFDVDADGHLILYYTGSTPPDFYINGNGHLILNLGNGNTRDLGLVTGGSAVSGLVDPAKYGIVQADYTAPFTAEQYAVAYQNGLGIQDAIDDAIAAGLSELTLPAGNYPLCYHAAAKDEHNAIIDASGIDLRLDGCKLYVIYDENGTNPYYSWTAAELEANGGVKNSYLLMGTILATDHSVYGGEIVGERALRSHENTKYRDSSCGIRLSKESNGNVIKNVKIHHVSGDGIGGPDTWGAPYISESIACTARKMVGGVAQNDTWSWLSTRMGIAYNIDTAKPIQVCSTGYTYFLWTTRPLKIHCFSQTEEYLGTVETKQGNPFYAPAGTFYVYVERRSGSEHATDATDTCTFRFVNGLYVDTIIDGCDISLNQRGGASNLPSGCVVQNSVIHDNGGAYGGMAAYYDGTQFGIDIEDWYTDRLTVRDCHFFGQINDILHRCNDLVIENSVFKGYVKGLNYAVNVRLSHSHFYSTVDLTTPASFGTKTAVGCEFAGTVSDAIKIVDEATEMKTLTITGAVSASYDGSADVTVDIPAASGGSSGGGDAWEKIVTLTTTENMADVIISTDDNGQPFSLKKMIVQYWGTGTQDGTGTSTSVNGNCYFNTPEGKRFYLENVNLTYLVDNARGATHTLELLPGGVLAMWQKGNNYSGGTAADLTNVIKFNCTAITGWEMRFREAGVVFKTGLTVDIWGVRS